MLVCCLCKPWNSMLLCKGLATDMTHAADRCRAGLGALDACTSCLQPKTVWQQPTANPLPHRISIKCSQSIHGQAVHMGHIRHWRQQDGNLSSNSTNKSGTGVRCKISNAG
jgi:hypothetical protein